MGGQNILPLIIFLKMYYVYIIYSQKIKKHYTGQTVDLDRRIEEHNRGKTAFLATGIPWKLVYLKEFETRKEAILLEKSIKKRGAERFLNDHKSQSG